MFNRLDKEDSRLRSVSDGLFAAWSPPDGSSVATIDPGETVDRLWIAPAESSGFAMSDPVDAGRPAGPDAGTVTVVPRDRPFAFPKLGEAVGGFRLISELGRGAFARVYLAHEVALGNRAVALKVTKAEGREPQVLARLQHAHIVPIHSLHDDPATGLRLICMPYVGGANLAQVLEAAGTARHSPCQSRGGSLLEALDLIGLPSPGVDAVSIRPEAGSMSGAGPYPSRAATLHRSLLDRLPWWPRPRSEAETRADLARKADNPAEPARQFIRASSYLRASVWIMARLAEGLDHAHSRGLLHRDLKPSNILVAADGTPMLLDFNLAADTEPVASETGEKAMMGGTLPYMSPEHLDAFNPLNTTGAGEVDERSDIYALGLILFEMVAGHPAFAEPPPGLGLIPLVTRLTEDRRAGAPSIRSVVPDVPWSFDAIVAKCLDPNPDRRYRSARELAEDLRAFLDDQPLRYTPEPSVRERVAKWSRRHPRASSIWTIVPVAAAITIGLGALVWSQATHLRQVGARLNLRRFHETFHDCQFLLNTSSGADLTDHLRRGVETARATIDRYRVIDHDRGGWDRGYWVASLTDDERRGLRRDLAELILLESRARVALAQAEGTEDDRRKALERAVVWLDRAERLDPEPSPALFAQRADYQRALGRGDLARLDRSRAETTPAVSSRDEYLLGTLALAGREFDRAETRLNRAVALDPTRFWAWFSMGLCHLDQGRYADAVGDFNVCAVLMPRFAWPHANRGFALARVGRLMEAIAAYDQAVALSPEFVDALLGRGLAHLEAGHAELAETDLRRAVALGSRDPSARAGLAEAVAKRGRRGEAIALYDALVADRPTDARLVASRGMIRLATDPTAASLDFRDALALDRRLALAHFGLARISYRTDHTRALAHLNQAIELAPTFLDAIELRALILARLGRVESTRDVDRLIQTPTSLRLYNASCALAILARNQPDSGLDAKAVSLLKRAMALGLPASTPRDDPDFAGLRGSAEFRALVGL